MRRLVFYCSGPAQMSGMVTQSGSQQQCSAPKVTHTLGLLNKGVNVDIVEERVIIIKYVCHSLWRSRSRGNVTSYSGSWQSETATWTLKTGLKGE